jgi:hypothetical protein
LALNGPLGDRPNPAARVPNDLGKSLEEGDQACKIAVVLKKSPFGLGNGIFRSVAEPDG